jgi:hypothetical protein
VLLAAPTFGLGFAAAAISIESSRVSIFMCSACDIGVPLPRATRWLTVKVPGSMVRSSSDIMQATYTLVPA